MESAKSSSKPKRKRGRVTGLRLDRQLIHAAKYRALDENTTLTNVVEKAIAAYLRTKQ